MSDVLMSVRKLATEIRTSRTSDRPEYQRLEALVSACVAMRKPICDARVPPDAMRAIKRVMPRNQESASAAEAFQEIVTGIASACQEGVSAAYPVNEKSPYSIYEKYIDGRVGGQKGVPCVLKAERVARFTELLSQSPLRDALRARLVAATPESLQELTRFAGQGVKTGAWSLVGMKMIRVDAADRAIRLPKRLDIAEYIAVHCDFRSMGSREWRAELQLCIAENYWGPHALVTANGYLNKYLAESAETVDYAIDQLAK